MPTLLIRPNDRKDYEGVSYTFDKIFDDYEKARFGEIQGNPVSEEVIEHVKVSEEKDISGAKGNVIADKVNMDIDGKEAFTSPNEQLETDNNPNLESSAGDKQDKGEQKSQSFFDYNQDGIVDTGDITAPFYDASIKAYGLVGAGADKVASGGKAMIEATAKSTAKGVSEGLDLEGKYAEMRSGAKEQIQSFKKELKEEADKKYEDLKGEVIAKQNDMNETLKTGLYVGGGILAIYLLIRK